MAKVNIELYEFLRARECHIEFRNEMTEVEAYVIMYTWDVDDLESIVEGFFNEVNEDFSYGCGNLCFSGIMDLMDWFGHDIRDYRHCFCEGAEWFEENKDDLSKILD